MIPFGLKNAGVIYQRATTTLLYDKMDNEVEVYMDDTTVKANEMKDHTRTLRTFFERLKEYRMRLNSKRCVFGVTCRKTIRIPKSGIEVDPAKIKAILEMKPPKTEKEVRSFLGRI